MHESRGGITLDEMAYPWDRGEGPASVAAFGPRSSSWPASAFSVPRRWAACSWPSGRARTRGRGRVLLRPVDPGSRLANELVKIGSLPVLLAGVAAIFLLAIFRDWVRAFACAAAPIVAVEVVEHIAKPMVGREIGGGSFTYPSGTVTAVAALAAAVFLVSPRLVRPLSALAGAAVVAAVGWAVLVLRWHYPTDVIGGLWWEAAPFFSSTCSATCP